MTSNILNYAHVRETVLEYRLAYLLVNLLATPSVGKFNCGVHDQHLIMLDCVVVYLNYHGCDIQLDLHSCMRDKNYVY